VGAVGVAAAAWPFIDQMNPSAAALAMGSTEIDLTAIQPGQQIVFKWRGQPLFVRRRTPAEIASAKAVDVSTLPDPLARNANLPETALANDADRATKPEWLILVGVCTHLGCVPLGQKPSDPRGEFGGWYCPCHGSQYDTSGRIRKGPAPLDLEVPVYAFETDTTVKIG
jgi:ubiquinol-cytochrome c reductase iron-sulfur subunit